jgi:DNA methylase
MDPFTSLTLLLGFIVADEPYGLKLHPWDVAMTEEQRNKSYSAVSTAFDLTETVGIIFHEFDSSLEVQTAARVTKLGSSTTRGIWLKPPTFSKAFFHPQFESFSIFNSTKYKLATELNQPRTTVFPCPYGDKSEVVFNAQQQQLNQCQKPLRLIKALIEKYYPYRAAGGVLDLFGGTGTTTMVALDCSLSCIYVDSDKENYDAAIDRFKCFVVERSKKINHNGGVEVINGTLMELSDPQDAAADKQVPRAFFRSEPRAVQPSSYIANHGYPAPTAISADMDDGDGIDDDES